MTGRSSRLAGLLCAALFLAPAETSAAPACPALDRLKSSNGWRARDTNNCELCMFNRVRIGPGSRLRWNGAPIDEARLQSYLRLTPAPHHDPRRARRRLRDDRADQPPDRADDAM